MGGRGVEFEQYDTPGTWTEIGIARRRAWFEDSEGNLVGVVRAPAGQGTEERWGRHPPAARSASVPMPSEAEGEFSSLGLSRRVRADVYSQPFDA
jgi:hypothetical protein